MCCELGIDRASVAALDSLRGEGPPGVDVVAEVAHATKDPRMDSVPFICLEAVDALAKIKTRKARRQLVEC